ncbi:M23 family metallopeptidase [Paenibacillus flagellatus]|uniref:M23 family metallopeptidase n=1 Tax=Paenibacillus flagellatus TaxID=2211139 RepID=UPI0011B6A81D|nr:M23 family metallopeptidase [Paenibacillus flagellatus]
MEIKSNVRQRRLDRMKQIVASDHGGRLDAGEPAGTAGGNPRPPAGAGRYGSGMAPDRRIRKGAAESEGSPGYRADGPLPAGERLDDRFGGRFDDPEYVWKRQERDRWSSWESPSVGGRGGTFDDGGLKPPSVRQIWVKLGISAVLFGAVWGLFRIDHPLADRGQQWVRAALTEDYDFSSVAVWYERTFGGLPAFLPAFRDKSGPEAQKASSTELHKLYAPVHGKIVAKASAGDLGITLRTEPEAPVVALDTGRVIAVSTGTDKGTVVVVQHTGGLQSTYGWLDRTTLKKHDWVKGGEPIGSVTTDPAGGAGKLYVAVKKDDQYVSPTEVVSFD